MLPSVLNHATGGTVMPSQLCNVFEEVACSQEQASSRKPAAITSIEERSERYLNDVPVHRIHQRRVPMNTHRFVWLLSHDEVNEWLAQVIGADDGFNVQPRLLNDGLPDEQCLAFIVDLDSVAPNRLAQQRLVKQLIGRAHPYPVAVFGYSLEDDEIGDLRAAGILVFPHCLVPEVFAAIAEQLSDEPSEVLVG
jgi:hypothetical protein